MTLHFDLIVRIFLSTFPPRQYGLLIIVLPLYLYYRAFGPNSKYQRNLMAKPEKNSHRKKVGYVMGVTGVALVDTHNPVHLAATL
jgi:hypothetical protein